jgi:hypothetical protein
MGGKITPGPPFENTTVRDYTGLRAAIDARRKALALTFEALDQRAGVADAYSSKLACGLRNYGPMSLGCILGALALELEVKAIEEQVEAA